MQRLDEFLGSSDSARADATAPAPAGVRLDAFLGQQQPQQPAGGAMRLDQYLSQPNPTEKAAGDYIRGHNIRTPEQISATYDAFRQNASGNTAPVHAPSVQEDAQRNATGRGFFANFGNALGRDIAKPIEGMAGLVSPEIGQGLRENNDLTYANTGAGGKVGGFIAGAVNSPYAMTPVGRALSAAEAAGNSRVNTAQARANGQDIDGAMETANATGTAGLDLAANVGLNKLFGKTVGSLGKQFAPQIADAALQGDVGAVRNLIVKQLAAKMGAETVGNDLVGRAHTLAQNAVNRVTTNPSQSLTEGQGIENEVNALINTGAFNLAGAHGAVHEAKTAAVEHVGDTAPLFQESAAARLFKPRQAKANAPQGDAQPNGESQPNGPLFLKHAIERGQAPGEAVEKQGEGQHTPSDRQNPEAPEAAGGNFLQRPQARGPVSQEADSAAGKPVEPEHPGELADAQAVGRHYATTYNDPENAPVIESIMGAKLRPGEKFVKATVPSDKLEPLNLTEDSRDPAKVAAIQNLTPEQRAAQPPVYVNRDLMVPDGGHRVTAAQNLGEPVTAYVPESLIGQHGITEAAKPPVAEQKPAQPAESFFNRMKRQGADIQADLARVASDESGAHKLTAHDLTGPGSIYHEEVKPALQSLGDFLHKGKEAFKSVFPVETGAGDKNAKLTFRARLAEGRQKTQSIAAEFDAAQQAFDKMTPDAQLDFHRRMYNQESQPTPELQKVSDAMYGHTNDGRQALVDLGHEAAEEWDKQKWNMLWKKDAAKAESLITRVNRPGKVEGKASFLKKQKLSEFDEGLARGLVPKFLNPAEQFMATTAERTKYIAGVRAMKDLADVGSITRIGPKDDIPAGWSEVPDGAKGPLNGIIKKSVLGAPSQGANGAVREATEGRLIAPDPVNRILHNVVTPSLFASGFRGSVYRALQGFNNQATSMLLGLSGFHATKVAKESMLLKTAQAFDLAVKGETGEGAKGAAGAIPDLLGNIAKGKQIQQQLLGQESATPEEARRNAAMIQGGFSAKSDSTYETKVRRRFSKALQQGGVQGMVRAAAYSPFALNEKVGQEGVFNYVQHNKLAIGASMTGDYLRQNPNATQAEIRENVGKISDHLDNVLGLMERDNLFWNRTARDIATLGTLSVGWNYGSAREAAGGLVDVGRGIGTLRRGGSISDIDTRRISYLMTMAATQAMGGAVATYLATGKGPQELKDYVFPKNGEKDANGHDVRLNFGLYTSDYYDFLTNPAGTLASKASPLIHAATSIIGNKDYRGRPIYDKDDPTDTLHYKMAEDIATHLATTNSPLTFQQIHNAIKEGGTAGKTLPDKLLPWLGIRNAPASVSQSPAEKAAMESMRRGTESREDAERADLIRDLSSRVRSKDPQAMTDARKAVRDGTLAGPDIATIQKRAHEAPGLQGLLKQGNLSPQDIMQRVWPKMSPDERRANQWVIRGRIGNAERVSAMDRQKWFKQIGDDVKAGQPQ
jgi:hypothetical protein